MKMNQMVLSCLLDMEECIKQKHFFKKCMILCLDSKYEKLVADLVDSLYNRNTYVHACV